MLSSAYADILAPGNTLIIHSLEMLSKRLLAANQFELAHLAIDGALEQEPYNFRPTQVHYDLLLARSEIFAKEGLDDEVRKLVSECEFYVFNESSASAPKVVSIGQIDFRCTVSGSRTYYRSGAHRAGQWLRFYPGAHPADKSSSSPRPSSTSA